MQQHIIEKYSHLKSIFKHLHSTVVAFSAGVDSTLLLKVAHDVLGGNAIAITAVSPTYPAEELEEAKLLAKQIDARLLLIKTNEINDENFSSNPSDRCFFCKSELFTLLKQEADKLNLRHVVYGANADDLRDFRPGMKAAKKLHAVAPLLEAHLTKEEIREISRELGLKTWNKPSYACLASRIPYGTKITVDALGKIEAGERILHAFGFKQSRLRYHNEIARIEILPEDFARLFQNDIRARIIEQLKNIGFRYITIDLEGYRTGSMNSGNDIQ